MPPTPEESERTLLLLRRWRDGDRPALNELLSEVQPWLRLEMSRELGDRPRDLQDSMDLAHGAVLEFLSWGPKFTPETGAQFRALLKRIAMNGLIDEQRRRSRRAGARHLESLAASNPLSGFAPALGSSQRPSREAECAEEVGWMRLALQFLAEEDRYLLLAGEVEGLDWATIAKELGIASPDTARMRCKRLKPRVASLVIQLRRGRMPETT